MAKIFLTGDTHFDHHNIIAHCSRPFQDVYEMNETMIERWNAVVSTDDVVFHLGDFCFRGNRAVHEAHLRKLNGEKHLIVGNHDKENMSVYYRLGWKSVHAVLDVKAPFAFTLFHYGMRTWNRSFHGAYHFFGHSHGRLPNYGRSCDVGVDSWNFAPVELEEAVAHINKTYTPRTEED